MRVLLSMPAYLQPSASMQGKQKVDLFHHMNAQNKAGPGWDEAPP